MLKFTVYVAFIACFVSTSFSQLAESRASVSSLYIRCDYNAPIDINSELKSNEFTVELSKCANVDHRFVEKLEAQVTYSHLGSSQGGTSNVSVSFNEDPGGDERKRLFDMIVGFAENRLMGHTREYALQYLRERSRSQTDPLKAGILHTYPYTVLSYLEFESHAGDETTFITRDGWFVWRFKVVTDKTGRVFAVQEAMPISDYTHAGKQ